MNPSPGEDDGQAATLRAVGTAGTFASPVSTADVAEATDADAATALERLRVLEGCDAIEQRTIGGFDLWWLSRARDGPSDASATGRPNAETAVQSEFRSLVDEVAEYAIFFLDPDGTVRTWNRGAERIKGYRDWEILGEHVSTFYPETDREAGVPERNLAAAAAEGSVETEGWRVRKDGSRFYASVVITAHVDAAGVLQGYTKVTRDASTGLERQRRARTLFDHSVQLAALLDADGTAIDVNETALDFAGVARADVVGEPFGGTAFWRATEVDAAAVEDAVRRAAAGETVRDEARLTGRDGSIPLEFSITPVFDGDGRVEYLVVEGRDVSAFREHERELERLARLNSVLRRVTAACMHAESPRALADVVCDTLLEFESYAHVVVGSFTPSYDAFEPWAEAGDAAEYVAAFAASDEEPLDESLGASAAKTGALQVYQRLDEVERPDWRAVAAESGIQSYAAIPLLHEETVYGVLGVYANVENAFTDEKRALLADLGSYLGYALYALERRELVDETIELVLDVPRVHAALRDAGIDDGTLTLDSSVALPDAVALQYWTVEGVTPSSFEAFSERLPIVEDVRLVSTVGATSRFEVTVGDCGLDSIVTAFDGTLESIEVRESVSTVEAAVPKGTDVDAMLDRLRSVYGEVRVVDKQRVLEPTGLRHSVVDSLTDRQHAALHAAFFAGFYDDPRGSTGAEIAERLGVTKQTFHYHLRNAERAVFSHLFEGADAPDSD